MQKLTKLLVGIIILISFSVGILRIGCFMYPKNYQPAVKKYAALYDIPDSLVFSVIKAESNYKKDAVSKKGARGLMQIMTPTGEWAAEKIGIKEFSEELLFDSDVNIEIGCYYLSYLLDLYNNETKLALAAYNAGPGNLIKWKKHVATSDPLLFLESIPSRETRSFAERIIVNYWIYRTLMGQPLLSLDKAVCGEWPNYQSMECQK